MSISESTNRRLLAPDLSWHQSRLCAL